MVRRIYVEKKLPYAVHAKELMEELQSYLEPAGLTKVRVLVRYDIENVSDDIYKKAVKIVFSEPPVDILYEETYDAGAEDKVFSVEYLPGQFDQRADSAEQCVKLLNESEEPVIRSAITYVLSGDISEEDFDRIKAYCINPVDSREADEIKPETLAILFDIPEDIVILDGFKDMEEDKLKKLYDSFSLAMTFKDFLHIQRYFCEEEKREPSMTEIRVLDTYWSDHCRHTTFLTELKNIEIEDGYYKEPILAAYNSYISEREVLYKNREDKDDKYISLMDIALLAMKKLRADNKLSDMEVSDEINACSIIVPVEIDDKAMPKQEEWLVFFKNETHNHPTEIEPFGGAATCLGGAIRDPLSGRGYVYQAMRVTGSADPTVSLNSTLEGKLPARKIVTGAAKGYSSYGNQIGLATGYVNEIYHPNYVAKRMEIGAVMGAAPRKNVVRGNSDPGDIIILMGGQTGRDGCGGATGSSKVHTTESINTCGAEVQKGNAPTERKLQRLFRREEVSRLIKKCNDFGAGGVSVAIGELAPGLFVDLDKVPKKYAGLDGTELAISESQERMAVVVSKNDVDKMLAFAEEENLEAVAVAEVTEEPRLKLSWRGKVIVDLSRAFLDTNGAHQEADAYVVMPEDDKNYFNTGAEYVSALFNDKEKEDISSSIKDSLVSYNENNTVFTQKWLNMISDLNVCSQKGLVEMFDSSIGAATVAMPYGGKYQMTQPQAMTAKLPVLRGECSTVSMMSYGYDPYLSSWSPYHGAVYAVISSVAKIVASGGDYKKIRFTFQEYFKRLGTDKKRWGEPLAALLGAYDAQLKLSIPSIGGKDSMSGTFGDIDVPPTLVSFAVNIAKIDNIITPELKKPANKLLLLKMEQDEYSLPNYSQFMDICEKLNQLIRDKIAVSAYALGAKGISEAVSKMAFGNGYGLSLDNSLTDEMLFMPMHGSFVVEVSEEGFNKVADYGLAYTIIGNVINEAIIEYQNEKLQLKKIMEAWTKTLENVFPTHTKPSINEQQIYNSIYDAKTIYTAKNKIAKPKVFIPVFPGTNCEYDSMKAFERAGADVKIVVFKNLSENSIKESVDAFEKAIKESQILMIPGGFSAGDEPDGSAKFIATVFRNAKLMEAVNDLLKQRDGLALGICNGFQAVLKLGMVPYGEIIPTQLDNSPTLTTNKIGRHISKSVYTKVVTNKSPWLMNAELSKVYSIPASHGEGRFVANDEWIKKLSENGQIATQYVDLNGCPTMDDDYNPNGSYHAIEGIISPDGRVLGKMAHSERIGRGVAVNIIGEQNQMIIESGVGYYL